MSSATVQRFQAARRDPSLVVLEGFHALKHAARFGATIRDVVTCDPSAVAGLAATLAPDLAVALGEAAVVSQAELAAMAPRAPRTALMALASRPVATLVEMLDDPRERPLVLLEDPRTMGNMGACVRVVAGAGGAGVLTTGPSDPWHPDAVRGAAGLHFAQSVLRIDELPAPCPRPLLAIDPEGDELDPAALPARAVLAFGTERDGLSADLLSRADARIRIPMEPGVSSLNLATSVAAVLYGWRLSRPGPRHPA